MRLMVESDHLWNFRTDSEVPIYALAFSDNGYLGVASADHCAYIFDKNGRLVVKQCGDDRMYDASFCCNKFGFVNGDDYTYIYDLSTETWKKMYVGSDYNTAITMLRDGFLAGGIRLALFDFSGHRGWSAYMCCIENGPAVHRGYVYVASWNWSSDEHQGALTILKLQNGRGIRTIKFDEENAYDAQACGNYLAVGTAHHVYLYDISDPTNPKLLWSYGDVSTMKCKGGRCGGARSVAFSPDCKYLMSADKNDMKFYIFDVETGKRILDWWYAEEIYSVAWGKNRIAVGFADGLILVYKTGYTFLVNKRKITVREMLFGNKEADQFDIE